MEEHARRYTTNQDNKEQNTFQITPTKSRIILRIMKLPSGASKLRAAAVIRVSSQVEKITLPLSESSHRIRFFFIVPFPRNPQVKISQYKNKGPYLQQLLMKLSLYMYSGAFRRSERDGGFSTPGPFLTRCFGAG